MKKLISILFLFHISMVVFAQSYPDTLRVGYVHAPPFIIDEEYALEGINIWLWKQVAEELNLEYSLVPMKFSEMLDGLQTGEIDVSINPLTITSERSKRMDFTHSYYASNSTVVIYESSSYQKLSQFVKSFFNYNFLQGFFVLLLIILFFGVSIWYFEQRVNPTQFRPGHKGLWDGLYWSVVTMTTVGYGDKAPKSRAGKMIALIWMFSGLLFISGLTASVASMLTINQLKTNPEGFFEYKDYLVGCIKNSSTNDFLKERFFSNIKLYESVNPGLKDLSNNKIDAFLYDEPILKYELKDGAFEHLKLMPIAFDLQFYAFGLAKGNPALRESISQQILEITEGLEWRMILKEYNLSEI